MKLIEPTIYIIDDMTDILEVVSDVLKGADYQTQCYSSGRTFLDQETELNEIGCLLLDNQMPELTGLEVQERLNQRGINLPIIFMSGASRYSDVVEAVKKGAFAFLQKPFSNKEILNQVKEAVLESRKRLDERKQKKAQTQQLELLTPREKQVYELVISGYTNKTIAGELSISVGTVEFHRANLMKKLNVSTLAELIAIC